MSCSISLEGKSNPPYDSHGGVKEHSAFMMGTTRAALKIRKISFTTNLYELDRKRDSHSIHKMHVHWDKTFGAEEVDEKDVIIHLNKHGESGWENVTATIDQYRYSDYSMSWIDWFYWQLQNLSDYQMQFEDHEPGLFRQVREMSGLSDPVYVDSFRATAKEKLSGGGSGAFLFYSADEEHIVKSISVSERDFLLQSFLSNYMAYMRSNPCSYLPRLYGCHTVRMYGSTISLLAMSNVFGGGKCVQPHLCYDIKGSWINRHGKTIKPGTQVTCAYCNRSFTFKLNANRLHDMCSIALGPCIPRRTLKDNDLQQPIRVDSNERKSILRQLRMDCDFLVQHGITDYSLLVGITNGEYIVAQDASRTGANSTVTAKVAVLESARGVRLQDCSLADLHSGVIRNSSKSIHRSSSCHSLSLLPASHQSRPTRPNVGRVSRCNSSVPPRVINPSERKIYHASTIVGPVEYYIGIVDILEPWSFKKKIERYWKVQVEGQDKNGISAMPPREYANRFLEKMSDVIQSRI